MDNEFDHTVTGLNKETSPDQLENKSYTIPVVEEKLHIGKKVIEIGKISVSKTVSEQIEIVNLPLVHEEVDIERISINQYVETPPTPIRYEGETMIIPVLREVMVIEKRFLLVEEIRVTKRQSHTEETQEVALRKEEIKIERSQNTNTNPLAEFF